MLDMTVWRVDEYKTVSGVRAAGQTGSQVAVYQAGNVSSVVCGKCHLLLDS